MKQETNNQMNSEHPALVDLDLLRTGEADDVTTSHVADCETCQEALSLLEQTAATLRIETVEAELPQADAAVHKLIAERVAIIKDAPQKHQMFPRWAIAAAAALALAAPFGWWFTRQPETTPEVAKVAERREDYAPDDVNLDGSLDILDAFALARQIESGARVPLTWDMNQDGRVDQLDIDLLAARAVQVQEES